jgi:hypothetical protein
MSRAKPTKQRDSEPAMVMVSFRAPPLLLQMIDHVAEAAGSTRGGWILEAIRARLVAVGDPIESLRRERAELAERLEEVDEALRKALKAAERSK